MAPANNIFSSPATAIFNTVCFDGDLFTCQCEKEDKKAKGSKISHCYGLFSNDIMAAKGLRTRCLWQFFFFL